MEQPNMEYIDSLAAGDLPFRQKLVGILKAELPQEIQEYSSNMENANLHAAAENVHKLKHKISLLGMEKSYYIAEQFEVNLKEGSTTLQDHFENILNSMQQFAAGL